MSEKYLQLRIAGFKSESFLDEVKESYTELINIYVRDDKEKLRYLTVIVRISP